MILLSSKKLESKLARGELGEWDKTKYLIFTSIFTIAANPVFWPLPVYMRIETTMLSQVVMLITWVMNGIITYHGIRNCFDSNKLTDGKSFIARFTVLFVPVSIQMFIVGLVVMFWMAISLAPFAENRELFQVLTQVTSMVFVYAFFFLLNRSFIRLSIEAEKWQSARGRDESI